MKKLFILLLLAFLIFFPACDDSSNSSDEADADTEEAVNYVAGEAIMISYFGMIQEVYSMPVDGVSRGIARLITVESTPIADYEGVTISGSYDFTTAEEFTADLDILFTDYSGVATINGTVNIVIDGDFSIPSYTFITSADQLEAVYNGTTYVMDFDFTVTITETSVSATGNIECNGSTIDFSYTADLSS